MTEDDQRPEEMVSRVSAERMRTRFIVTALIALALIAGIIGTTIFAVRANRQRIIAEEQRAQIQEEYERTERAYEFMTWMISLSRVGAATWDMRVMRYMLGNAAREVDKKFQDQPRTEADIRLVIGNTYRSLRMYEEAQPQLEKALSINRRVLGDDHPDTLKVLTTMCWLFSEQEKYDEALPFCTESMETSRRVLGEEHPDTLTALNTLGGLYSSQGQYEEATKYKAEALEIRRRVLGNDHGMTLIWIDSMAGLLRIQGRYDEALACYTEIFETRRRVQGETHPETRNSLNTIIFFHDALHREDPTAGHDAKAQEWRAEKARLLAQPTPTEADAP